MELTFLGTSSGTPTRQRNVAGLALRFDDGRAWVVDCGEATQHRLLVSDVRPARIELIALTHLHGDHCYGLPGLLSCLAVHGRRQPVLLLGPPGTRELVETALRISHCVLGYRLDIHEHGGDQRRWRCGSCTIDAWPIRHRVPCWGYRVVEDDRPGRFDANTARQLGVTAGPDFGRLRRGETVRLADGREIDGTLLAGPPRRGRHLVVLGDTNDASGIAAAARGCDVLVHEATYADGREADGERWGHATAGAAGRFAGAIGCRHLVLTHFSSRYTAPGAEPGVDILRQQAAAAAGPEVTVHLADDLATARLAPIGDDGLCPPLAWRTMAG